MQTKPFKNKKMVYTIILAVSVLAVLSILFDVKLIALDTYIMGIIIVLMTVAAFAYILLGNSLYWAERQLELFVLDEPELPKAKTLQQKRFVSLLDQMQKRIKYLSESEYLAEILRREAELNALQSQINPHFLYNTLEAIRGYALQKEVVEISDMTEALSSLFRYSIKKQGKYVSIAEELENVKCYLTIQQYRFPGKITYHEFVDNGQIDLMQYYIPNLTIQPFIENSLHHGIEAKVGKGNVWLKIYATDKRIIISVKDDGIGIKEERLKEINQKLYEAQEGSLKDSPNNIGIAMTNINRRLKMQYGEKYGVSIVSSYGIGTEVEVSLPLKQRE